MAGSSEARASRGRLTLAYALYCLFVFAVVFGVAEAIARWRGATVWDPQPAPLSVSPGDRLYRADPALGYGMLPGRFTVRFPTGDAFTLTNGEDSLRRSRPAGQASPAEAPALWIFGCSFSYGWGVDDEDVYAWHLQEALPRWDVTNFSVNGYGTLQSLLQLEEALDERPAPAVVVLAYAAFHDARNTFLRERRKRVAPFSALGPLVQPFARLDPDDWLQVQMADVTYREGPGIRWSALAHTAEQRWNDWESRQVDSARVTEVLIARFVRTARAAGARVIVAGIAGRFESVLTNAQAAGAEPLMLAVDLSAPGMRNPPPDGHPSPRAHRRYAQRLLRAVQEK